MVLASLNKTVLKRLRTALKREQRRTGQDLPTRAMKFFGRLKNVDERAQRMFRASEKNLVEQEGRRNFSPLFAVRSIRIKAEKEGVILKLPTLATHHFRVTPQEEIRFVRRMVDMVNNSLKGKGFVILKPIAHPVGPFIAMRRTNLPTIDDLNYFQRSPKVTKMLSKISSDMGITPERASILIRTAGLMIETKQFNILNGKKVRLSIKYPAGSFIQDEFGIDHKLKPLSVDHLQIVGVKNGVIQLVPFVDAI